MHSVTKSQTGLKLQHSTQHRYFKLSCTQSMVSKSNTHLSFFVYIYYPGDLPNSGIKPMSSGLQADSLPSEPPGKHVYIYMN